MFGNNCLKLGGTFFIDYAVRFIKSTISSTINFVKYCITLLRLKAKNHQKVRFFGGFCRCTLRVVELPGVEPGSKQSAEPLSTCLFSS
jgi:hypothetical protein